MRFKTVIIDDNVNTVKSLLVSIDWSSLGIEVAGTAYNGSKGKELIRQAKPDIIITDINMPEMDGLSMLELANSDEKNTKVIVITGYDKFQYAHRAIKLSVFDYILKPIDNNELNQCLMRARLSLENDISRGSLLEQLELNNQKVRLLSYLTVPCSGINHAEEEKRFFFILIGHAQEGISRPLLERVAQENFPGNMSVVSVPYEDYLVLLCTLKNEDPVWQKYAKNAASKLLTHSPGIGIAVSGIHDSFEKIQEAFFNARKALLSRNVLSSKQNIIFYEEEKFNRYSSLSESEEALEKIIIEDLKAESYELLYNVLVNYSDGSMESVRTLLMIFSLKVLDRRLKQSAWPKTLDRLIYGVSKINSISEIKQWYTDFINEVNITLDKELGLDKIIRDIQNYIRLYAAGGLTLKSTAEKFNLSPNYLSALLHKETGKTYQAHVLKAKMDAAKQMLDDTRIKIEEIGHSIGYQNYVSFYKAFKNLEGITPSDYRFRNRS